jgi:NAD(P)-dependent dehydrogenase (short-subunit alcohol dehydrogenase family)
MDIKNSVALVTGTNRGVGRAIVEALVAAGARKVYAAARNTDGIKDLVAAGGGKIEAVQLDITNDAQVAAAAAHCKDVNLLINNAGSNHASGCISAPSLQAARAEMETNYFGTLAMCRAFAPALKANGGGALVNVVSIVAKATIPAYGSYSASKGANLRMTESVRAELAAQKTAVHAVMTGAVDTDMAKGYDGPKNTTAEVAQAVLAGVQSGEEDIYVGDMTGWINGALKEDPKGLEKQLAAFLPG